MTKLAPPGTGSNPVQRRYTPPYDPSSEPLPIPWWFQPLSSQRFHSLPLHDSDIIVSSGVKMGTTWLTKILVSLLFEYDNAGKICDNAIKARENIPNRLGQTYPDAMYANRDDKEGDVEGIFRNVPNGREACDAIFGDFTFEDLVNQPEPRIFTTHVYGKRFLPQQLFDEAPAPEQCDKYISTKTEMRKGKGRLIIVLRNLKDTMCSLHHFRGLPLDDWDGNEHGPGTYSRFIAENCPNAFGSAFQWIKETNNALTDISADRVHVIYYESLMLDFDAQLKELNNFLGLNELTDAKCGAVREACAAKMMAKDAARYGVLVEKAKIGEWEKYLDEKRWMEFDNVFDKRLGNVGIAEPLKFFQQRGFKSKLDDDRVLKELRKTWRSVNKR